MLARPKAKSIAAEMAPAASVSWLLQMPLLSVQVLVTALNLTNTGCLVVHLQSSHEVAGSSLVTSPLCTSWFQPMLAAATQPVLLDSRA